MPRSSLVPFLLVSLALHLSLWFAWRKPSENQAFIERIPVSVIPEHPDRQERSAAPSSPAPEPRARAAKEPGRATSKTPAPSEVTARRLQEAPSRDLPVKEQAQEEVNQPGRGKYSIVQRPLPTLKELLPPVTWSASADRASKAEGAVPLNTSEPKYVSYFTSIKRAIEQVWEYPEPALRYGIQGKLVLEFTISGSGQLEGTRLLRTSGYSVLDQEAIRAVQAASPFRPIPPGIGKPRLDVVASFEYHDNRLRYGGVP